MCRVQLQRGFAQSPRWHPRRGLPSLRTIEPAFDSWTRTSTTACITKQTLDSGMSQLGGLWTFQLPGVKEAGPRRSLSRILGTGRERKDLSKSVPADNEETFEHFGVHGWMRVRGAFSVDEAAAM